MKIAIISDIHANLEALLTTFDDIEKRNVDKIFCLGDIIAKGINAKECISLVSKKCDIVLQGNTDKYFAMEHKDILSLPEIEQKRIEFNRSLISDKDREYLLNLPFSYEFYLSGRLVRLFHASPEANNKTIVNQDSIDTKYEMFLPSKNTMTDKIADVVLYGHLHHQYMDKFYNKTLINVGSVGNSFEPIRDELKDSSIEETTCINYVILEGEYGKIYSKDEISFSFIRVPYDIKKELASNTYNIEYEAYRAEIQSGLYRNMEKINKKLKDLKIK